MSRRFPRRLAGPMLALSSMMLMLLAGEAGLRLIHWLQNPSYRRVGAGTLRSDPILGWTATENYLLEGRDHDAEGRAYEFRYETDEYGFRKRGDAASARPRILVIGDSFTQAEKISSDKAYFGQLESMLDAEVFAFGCGGHGTLQELMALEARIGEVKPGLVLWQFCTNDLINNDPGLERESRSNNNGMRRPYMTAEGEIVRILPARWAALREFGVRHSELVNFLFARVDRIATRWEGCESRIGRNGADDPGLRRSVETTAMILRRVREVCGGTPVAAFCADAEPPYLAEIQRLCEQAGFDWIEGVNAALAAAEAAGVNVRLADGAHWNETGHRVCAEAIAASAPFKAFRREKPPLTPGSGAGPE